jgi:uncharacterized protein involved in exopolysaccharide biosynthesis
MVNNNNPEVIDLRVVAQKIWKRKKLFIKTLSIAFVLSCIYILGIPRVYTTNAKLAPEMESSTSGGALSSIASSLGFDISNMQTSDAISPLLYPDLMEDNKFVASLFDIKVETIDGEVKTTFYDYIKTRQQISLWSYPKKWLKSLLPKPKEFGKKKGEADPYQLSREDYNLMEAIRKKVQISFDKRTGVITIETNLQDPLVCRTVADSVTTRLQNFITEYRTNKARTDMEYYKKLTAEAKMTYEKARRLYGSFADANTDVVLQSYQAKQNDLENDMQLKYNMYTSLNTQMQMAQAKLQEATPAFTVLQGASVPVRPAGPKRLIIAVAMTMLAFFGITGKILFNSRKVQIEK